MIMDHDESLCCTDDGWPDNVSWRAEDELRHTRGNEHMSFHADGRSHEDNKQVFKVCIVGGMRDDVRPPVGDDVFWICCFQHVLGRAAFSYGDEVILCREVEGFNRGWF